MERRRRRRIGVWAVHQCFPSGRFGISPGPSWMTGSLRRSPPPLALALPQVLEIGETRKATVAQASDYQNTLSPLEASEIYRRVGLHQPIATRQ
jgi:hypothetical protein